MHSIVVNKQVITISAFTAKKTLYGKPSQIPAIAGHIDRVNETIQTIIS